MAYYKTMTQQALKAAYHSAKINIANNDEASERARRAGLDPKTLRSTQVAAHWRQQKALIEAVARARRIAL